MVNTEKEAMQYLVEEVSPIELFEIHEQQYSSKPLHHVKQVTPAAVNISTLTGLVDYIKSGLDWLKQGTMLVQVVSPTQVKVLSQLKGDAGRDCFIDCQMQPLKVIFDNFIDTERFNIMMQACFIENEDSMAILKIVGNIKENTVRETGDDGISQEVTIKSGIARAANVVVPNPVSLRPYRTFTEVYQPESRFIFRMQEGPKAALFEADGGTWKHTAMENIKIFLESELADCDVKIIS